MMDSNAPVWLITGCSRGFGRELARPVLKRGHDEVRGMFETNFFGLIALTKAVLLACGRGAKDILSTCPRLAD